MPNITTNYAITYTYFLRDRNENHNSFSSKSNLSPNRPFLWKWFTLRILWVLVFCCAKFHKIKKSITGISRYLGISAKKGMNYA